MYQPNDESEFIFSPYLRKLLFEIYLLNSLVRFVFNFKPIRSLSQSIHVVFGVNRALLFFQARDVC